MRPEQASTPASGRTGSRRWLRRQTNLPLFSADQVRESPSRTIGMTEEQETRMRLYVVTFLADVAKNLGLHREALATATTLLQRFYMVFPFNNDYDKYHVISACICLAGKLEEERLHVQRVAEAVLYHRHRVKVDRRSPEFASFHQAVLSMEVLLLQAIRFKLCASHPYDFLDEVARSVLTDRDDQFPVVVEYAARFVHDSFKTTACVVDTSENIAIACVHMALIWTNMGLADDQRIEYARDWFLQYKRDADARAIESICELVLHALEHPLHDKAAKRDPSRPQGAASLSPNRSDAAKPRATSPSRRKPSPAPSQ